MASSRKTQFFDLLQLNALKFYNSNNAPMPSSTILTARGNGETYFTSISSIMGYTFQNIFVPGQQILSSPNTATLTISSLSSDLILSTNNINTILFISATSVIGTLTSTLNSVQASTMYNTLNYINMVSSIPYIGNVGLNNVSTLATNSNLVANGSALFSTLQMNLSSFSRYINPNGNTKLFIDYYPNILLAPVMLPSSISSTTLYPEGNDSLFTLITLSSHFIYSGSNGLDIPILKSGAEQYLPVISSYPYGISSIRYARQSSNIYVQPFKMEFDTALIRSNVAVVHYLSNSIGTLNSIPISNGFDVRRSGLDSPLININNKLNDKSSVFLTITNG